MGSAWNACSSVATGPSQEALAQPLQQPGQGAPCCQKAYVTDSPAAAGTPPLGETGVICNTGSQEVCSDSGTLLFETHKCLQTNKFNQGSISGTFCYFIHKSGLIIAVFNTKWREFPAVESE